MARTRVPGGHPAAVPPPVFSQSRGGPPERACPPIQHPASGSPDFLMQRGGGSGCVTGAGGVWPSCWHGTLSIRALGLEDPSISPLHHFSSGPSFAGNTQAPTPSSRNRFFHPNIIDPKRDTHSHNNQQGGKIPTAVSTNDPLHLFYILSIQTESVCPKHFCVLATEGWQQILITIP